MKYYSSLILFFEGPAKLLLLKTLLKIFTKNSDCQLFSRYRDIKANSFFVNNHTENVLFFIITINLIMFGTVTRDIDVVSFSYEASHTYLRCK